MVLGDVRLSLDRESLGLDRRGSSRDSGTAAAVKPTVVSRPTLYLAYYLDTLRRVITPLFYQNSAPSCKTQHDGHVRL